MARCLGLDVGEKRIGVALSDPAGILASPLTIVERTDDEPALQAIVDIIERHQVSKIIAGLPRSMNGRLGDQAQRVKVFIDELSHLTEAPVEFRDERLTTVAAQRLMRATPTRKARRKRRDDAIAAALILQGYLDETRI